MKTIALFFLILLAINLGGYCQGKVVKEYHVTINFGDSGSVLHLDVEQRGNSYYLFGYDSHGNKRFDSYGRMSNPKDKNELKRLLLNHGYPVDIIYDVDGITNNPFGNAKEKKKTNAAFPPTLGREGTEVLRFDVKLESGEIKHLNVTRKNTNQSSKPTYTRFQYNIYEVNWQGDAKLIGDYYADENFYTNFAKHFQYTRLLTIFDQEIPEVFERFENRVVWSSNEVNDVSVFFKPRITVIERDGLNTNANEQLIIKYIEEVNNSIPNSTREETISILTKFENQICGEIFKIRDFKVDVRSKRFTSNLTVGYSFLFHEYQHKSNIMVKLSERVKKYKFIPDEYSIGRIDISSEIGLFNGLYSIGGYTLLCIIIVPDLELFKNITSGQSYNLTMRILEVDGNPGYKEGWGLTGILYSIDQ